MGGKIDHSVNRGRGPYTFRIGGENTHLIGSLLPKDDAPPKFCQLYIYDTEDELKHRKNALSSNNSIQFDDGLMTDLKQMLDRHNVLVKSFRMARDRIHQGSDGEVVALIVGDFENTIDSRDIVVEERCGRLQRISELHASYLALQYPILFPRGEDGHRLGIPHSQQSKTSTSNTTNTRDKLTLREWFAFCIQDRSIDKEYPTILLSGKAFQQFLADGCTMIESDRLKYIRFNQPKLRSENFKNLANAAAAGQTNPSSAGVRFIIPSSFVGGKGYMRETYQDTMTICWWCGYPDLFITFTCNPKWPEITRFVQKRGLRRRETDIVTRVFKLKLYELMRNFKELHIFGRTRAVVYTIEFQKRGLPHAHILLFLQRDDKFPEAVDVDHSPCMIDGICSKKFPKKFNERTTVDGDGYPVYMRRDNGRTIEKNGKEIHNGYVVPYNADLLLKYRAHINVEWCNQARSIKYLFKTPPVLRLDYHLPNEQNVIFHDEDPIDEVVERSSGGRTKFTAWLEYNNLKSDGRDLTYWEFPQKFVWKEKQKVWTPRHKGFTLGRMYHMSPNGGERYYLRTLLNFVKGPKSYEDIRTVNGFPHPTFKEACYALGLLGDDKEYIDAIKEASFWGTGCYLRNLFATLLLTNSLVKPELVWEETWKLLSDDILYRRRTELRNPVVYYQLMSLKKLFLRNFNYGKNFNMQISNSQTISCKLTHYPRLNHGCKEMAIADELAYDKDALNKEHEKLTSSMTDEQKSIYRKIMYSVYSGQGGVYFVYGYGGTGKTFLWKTLCAGMRSKGEIVIAVASSGIASILLPGGRTAHAKLSIPINIDENSTCHGIRPGTDLADLLIRAKLIIWDEAPMVNRYCFEALDRSMRDIMRTSSEGDPEKPFGGKVLKLTKNMRLQVGSAESDVDEIRQFSKWILEVGDGLAGGPNDGVASIELPEDILIQPGLDAIATIVESTYPSLKDHLGDHPYFTERAVLAPTHDVVEEVNDYVLDQIQKEEKVYLSSDEISKEETNYGVRELYSTEFLNSIRCSGLPNHRLKLKVGAIVMLLRNIDQANGLCNGTRMEVNHLGNRVISATVISGSHIGSKVYIPRITLTPTDVTRFPIKFERRQFPLAVCFAMTINKSQGQSLSRVGLYLPRPVFTHGQLYVAISRVTSRKGLKVLLLDEEGGMTNTTTNVVYKEIFEKL
ncbi:uncharacterized protein LOC141629368 [Silene latifolia]|uniref:uncharacterized protein LOC141629368 n=1 Tax=Silene latifolia TaxID=37657 RepID=UPI003D773825